MSGIDKIITKSEDISLSGSDIKRITDDKVSIYKYEYLESVSSIDELLEPYGAVVLLYETKQNFGHWVGLFRKNPNTLEFFDPYGLAVDAELSIDNKLHLREHNGQIVPHLSALISRSQYYIVSNERQLQKFLPHTNTCGRWVAMRIRFRDISLQTFINLMTENAHYDGDFWVSALSMLV